MSVNKQKFFSFFSFLLIISLFFIVSSYIFAQTPPASETAGGVEQQRRQIQQEKMLEEKIKKERPKPEEVVPEEIIPEEEGERILIKKIVVEGASLIPEGEIEKLIYLTSSLKNKRFIPFYNVHQKADENYFKDLFLAENRNIDKFLLNRTAYSVFSKEILKPENY